MTPPPPFQKSYASRVGLGSTAFAALGGGALWMWMVFSTSRPASAAFSKEGPIPAPNVIDAEPIKPIPPVLVKDPGKVALGKALFHDARLSQDDTVSCASCHDLGHGGVDGLSRSVGVRGAIGRINAPTVLNSSLNFRQFWDGRALTLEDQMNDPIRGKEEMATSWPEILSKLSKDPRMVARFQALYRDGLTAANIRDAIATFERSLLTPNARFDKFLRGDLAAITPAEKEGYLKFKSYGCVSCHQGVNVGGNMFEKFGVMADYFAARGDVTVADYGRFNVTGREDDRYVFRVPSLRNVALCGPYFHDGSAKRLEDAVAIMGRYQLDEPLSEEDIAQIVLFLKTLTGELEGKPL